MPAVSAMTSTPTLTTTTVVPLETTQNLATSSTMMKTRRKISTQSLKTPTLATSKIASNTTKTRSGTLITTSSTASWDRARMSAKSRKVIKTVVVIFTILCLPVDLFHLLYYTLIKAGIPILPVIESVILPINTMLNIMQISNSVANIFIYSKMHVFFRKMVLAPMRIRKISLGPGRKMSFQDSIRKVGERRAIKKVRSKSFHWWLDGEGIQRRKHCSMLLTLVQILFQKGYWLLPLFSKKNYTCALWFRIMRKKK